MRPTVITIKDPPPARYDDETTKQKDEEQKQYKLRLEEQHTLFLGGLEGGEKTLVVCADRSGKAVGLPCNSRASLGYHRYLGLDQQPTLLSPVCRLVAKAGQGFPVQQSKRGKKETVNYGCTGASY